MSKQKFEETKGMTYAEKVEYFSKINDLICMNNNNAKTGVGVLTLSLPAQTTCRKDAPCYNSHICYCLKGHQCFPNVCGAYYRNWRLWNENPENFEEMVISFTKYSGIKMVRWHDAGEIPNMRYLKMMVRIAKTLPSVRFLAYTKKYDLINSYLDVEEKFPDNLTIRFSYWDKDWQVNNKHDVPTAYVKFIDKNKNPTFPSEMFECEGNADPKDLKHTCSCCQMCWDKDVKNVVFKQH